MSYHKKARLIEDIAEIEQYRRILDGDKFQENEMHWNSISKNAMTLFQVLIDQDLTHLVAVLKAYPRYVPIVCEHFRYAYSYSENEANIDAVSNLLYMGEAYFTKQFVRNLVRKLPGLDSMNLEELKAFSDQIFENQNLWHPIVVNLYCTEFSNELQKRQLHPLQKITLTKKIVSIAWVETYDFEAKDRDAALDIPYMN
ncbi:MAG: hypothetical protein U9N52_09510 [Campylobacterota bacterium]|nr:hypothetical protein [Campylobacterota bacterium]